MHDAPLEEDDPRRYDPSPNQPLDPSMIDLDRFRGVVDRAIEEHPDKQRIAQLFGAGAQPFAFPVQDGEIRITLDYFADAERPAGAPEPLELTRTAASVVKRVNQG